MMRREGRRVLLELGFWNNRKGDGRGGDGGVKLLRSSSKNLEGGGMSVIASSIYILCVVQDTASFVNAQIIGAVT